MANRYPVLVLKVNGHKVNAFPVVMLPSAALAGLAESPAWNFIAVTNLILLWTLGWGEAVGGPHDSRQPTPFLRSVANLVPTLGVAAAVWTFRQPQPLGFWIASSIYFASVQWLSKKQLRLFPFIFGWLCLWGLTVGGHFQASMRAGITVYTLTVVLTVTLLHLASWIEGRVQKVRNRMQASGASAASCEGEIGFDS